MTATDQDSNGAVWSKFEGICLGVGTVCAVAAALLWQLADSRIATAESGYSNNYIELHDRLINLRNGAAVVAVLSLLAGVLLNR